MSTKTENLKLTKPAATDLVDISAINENMDIIDENLITRGEVNELKENLDNTDAALRSENASTKRDLQITAGTINNRIDNTDAALRHEIAETDATLRYENESTKRDLQITAATINNRIDNLVVNTGDSNSEIVDARVGSDGVTYGSLGTAIRTQVKNIYDDLKSGYESADKSIIENLHTTTERIEDEVDQKVKSLRLYRDAEGYLCETEG